MYKDNDSKDLPPLSLNLRLLTSNFLLLLFHQFVIERRLYDFCLFLELVIRTSRTSISFLKLIISSLLFLFQQPTQATLLQYVLLIFHLIHDFIEDALSYFYSFFFIIEEKNLHKKNVKNDFLSSQSTQFFLAKV